MTALPLKPLRALALAAITAASVAGTASASVIVSSAVGGAPTGVSYANFDNLSLGSAGGTSGGIGVSFLSGDGGIVQGAASGLYAAPFLSGGNGSLFGNPGNGADTTRYLSTGIGTIKLALPGQETYFGLLWGSVDAYNSLKLFNGSSLVGTITGSDVTAHDNGDQGASGTFYVNINSDLSFDTVELISTQYAFEADNIAYGGSRAVPEPGTIALFGIGLIGLIGFCWRRNGRRTTDALAG
jgi:hypothetical protein